MQFQRLFRRSLLIVPLVMASVACDGDSTGPAGLSPEEVAGVYSICTLTFTPEGGFLPAVDIRDKAMETNPQGGIPAPTLTLNPISDRQFELAYVPRGQLIAQRPSGTYGLGRGNVTLNFSSGGATSVGSILLPNSILLDFQTGPNRLQTAAGQSTYLVPRANYARLAGVSETNLPDQVRGALAARFAVGGCS
jgi:hypothetical protein